MAMTDIITSLQNSFVKKILSLRLKKNRADMGLFAAQGVRTVSAGLAGSIYRPETILFSEDEMRHPDIRALQQQAARQKVKILVASGKVMEKISGRDNPQPVIGVFQTFVSEIAPYQPAKSDFIVALDRVRDPGNLGTIMRTMDAVGAGTLFLIGEGCDPFAPEVLRAAMGSFFHTRIACGSENDFIHMAKNFSGQIIGTDMQNAVDYRQIAYRMPAILMMGNEQSGLSQLLLNACTNIVKLPMRGNVESLNVSVATAVMLYKICS